MATLTSTCATSEELAPGDVQWAFLDQGSPYPDAIVVGTGSHSVEVYRPISITDGVPSFAPSPEIYFVGSAPVSVTVADSIGDGIHNQLVAKQGSNDVSEIFGSHNADGTGRNPRAAVEFRGRRPDRGDRGRFGGQFDSRPCGRQRRERYRDPVAGRRRQFL